MLLIGFAACTSDKPTAQSTGSTGCRKGPALAGVWSPDRLQLLAPCKHVSGMVEVTQGEPDGDHHVWLLVDAGYEYLLDDENHFQAKPALLAEITPSCPLDSNPPNAEAAARCPPAQLPIPVAGAHIAIDGPWVLDTDHGWREIHPVEAIQILAQA